MVGDIKSVAIRRLVLRALVGREMYGYEILARLRAHGIRTGTNYLYEILSSMEDEGLLKGRWSSNPSGKPSRHYYSLGAEGRKEVDAMVREAIDLIYERLLLTGEKGTPALLKEVFSKIGAPLPKGRFVVALPDSNPAISYQLHLRSVTGGLRGTTMYVVKPAGIPFPDPPDGVTILDGRRDDLPFKDGFADFLMVTGLPAYASVEKSIAECSRVLADQGHFVLKHPNSLTEDRAPAYLPGAEQYAKLVYENYDLDRTVNIGRLVRKLSVEFDSVRESVFGGSTWVHAQGKRT